MGQGEVSIDGQEDDIAFPCRFFRKKLDLNVPVLGFDSLSRTAFGSKNAQLIHLELATGFQALADFLANGTGGTHNADTVVQGSLGRR